MHTTDHLPLFSLQQALAAAQRLGLERLDAQWLLLHAVGRPLADRAWLLAHGDDCCLSTAERALFSDLCQRWLAGEPLAYLLGQQEFFGLTLAVDRRVLVPRSDTEVLVNWGLEVLRGLEAHCLAIVDLGTGSGAVALALAQGLLQTRSGGGVNILAVDSSLEALQVASSNVQQLKRDNWPSIELVHSHWLDSVVKPLSGFDLIVSNPPYIAAADPHLAALAHEPTMALVSGSDGLDDLRQITAQAPDFLRPGGWLLLEHGYNQAIAVRKLLVEQGFCNVQSRCDLAGIERCSGGSR